MDSEQGILHIDSEKGYRGGQRQVLLLHQGLLAKGGKSHLVVRKGSALEEYCVLNKLPFSSYSIRTSFDLVAAYRIARKARREGYQALHAHAPNAIVLCLMAKLFVRSVRIVVTRRVFLPIKKKWFSRFKYNGPWITKVVSISKSIDKLVAKTVPDSDRRAVIYDGIDTEGYVSVGNRPLRDELGIFPKDTVVGTIAAFTQEKDYKTLVQAAIKVVKQNRDVVFVCCGDGDQRDEIEALVQESGLGSFFRFTGFVANIHDYLSTFDVFALPSRLEGLGTSILDAQFYSLPIVACRTGGIPEVVEDQRSGLLCDVGNGQQFASALLRLVGDEELRAEYGKIGKQKLQYYTKERMVDRHIDLYNAIEKL